MRPRPLSPAESESGSAGGGQAGSVPGDPRLPPIGPQRSVGTGRPSPLRITDGQAASNHHRPPVAPAERSASGLTDETDAPPSGCCSLCSCGRLPRLLSAFGRRGRRRRRASVHPTPQPADQRPRQGASNDFIGRELTTPPRLAPLGLAADRPEWDAGSVEMRSFRAVPGPAAEGRLQLPWLPPEEQLSTEPRPSGDQHRTAPHDHLETTHFCWVVLADRCWNFLHQLPRLKPSDAGRRIT